MSHMVRYVLLLELLSQRQLPGTEPESLPASVEHPLPLVLQTLSGSTKMDKKGLSIAWVKVLK